LRSVGLWLLRLSFPFSHASLCARAFMALLI
jgi:hypothetical protein